MTRPFGVKALGLVPFFLLVLAVGCGESPGPVAGEQRSPASTTGGWSAGATSPLSPRWGSLMAWTGEEVLVIGGFGSAPCPPGADCAFSGAILRDGAAYDPAANTWRALPAAPFDLSRETGHAVVDGSLVVGVRRDWAVFDPSLGIWEELPAPPGPGEVWGPEAEHDGLVYVADRGRRIQVLDLASRTWSTIPTDDLKPHLADSMIFATEAGLLLAGVDYEEAAPDEPTFEQVDLWDGEQWRRLPRTGQLGWFYYWTGARLLGIEQGGADGGQVNGWGEWHPYGGALDPVNGDWEPLDGLPGLVESDGYFDLSESWPVEAAEGPLVATSGRVYDDRTRTWTDPGRPDSEIDYELTATWADGRLVFFGGYDQDAGFEDSSGLSNETWVWAP